MSLSFFENMDKQQKIIIGVMVILLLVALVTVAVLLLIPKETVTTEFTPPAFDDNAVSGMPDDVPESLNYGSPTTQNEFGFLLCGTPAVTQDNRLRCYFTSPSSNRVWLLLKIYDGEGNLLGASGLLRPGEYVEYIALDQVIPKGSEIRIKVLSYEADTYYSKGTAQGLLRIAE